MDAGFLATQTWAGEVQAMKDWRCLIGRHQWRLLEKADHDKYSECARCGKRDYVRHFNRAVGGRDMGNLPQGG